MSPKDKRLDSYIPINQTLPMTASTPLLGTHRNSAVLYTSSNESFTTTVAKDDDDEVPGQASWFMAALLLVNVALGAGLLNYPVAYDRLGGIGFATVIQVFAVILMATTMLVLVYCARLHNESSYHGVLRTMCGRKVMQLAAGSISITCFGICVTFLIIIGDQFDRIFTTYIGSGFCTRWYAHRYFTMSATAILTIWPMCYFRRLDFLRHVNLLGVFASFYVIFLNVYMYYVVRGQQPELPPTRTSPTSLLEFTAALPVVFFAFQTHELVVPVHVSMKDRSIGAFSKATALSLAILLVLYCLGGTYGYLTFGSDVAPDIMLMYDAGNPLVVAGILALVVKMIATYPQILFSGRDTIVRLLLARTRKPDMNANYEAVGSGSSSGSSSTADTIARRYNLLITTIWNAIVLLLAIVTPNITVAIGCLGSLASCNVFLFPSLALISLARRWYRDGGVTEGQRSFSRKHRWLPIALIGYGILLITIAAIMFVVILIQVYHDFQQEIPHGAVCDVDGSGEVFRVMGAGNATRS